MFVDKAMDLPQSRALERFFTRVGSGLPHKHQIRLERLARYKCLFSITNTKKVFITLTPGQRLRVLGGGRGHDCLWNLRPHHQCHQHLRLLQVTRGHIFRRVRPYFEHAVSDLDTQRSMHRPVQVTQSSFIEGLHRTKKMASAAILININSKYAGKLNTHVC